MHSTLSEYGQIFVGRQPILGPKLATVGYEVLYRNCEVEQANFMDEGTATATVLLNTYLDIGLEHVVGSHLAFLNIPQGFLTEQFCDFLPKNRVVLEILENVEPTRQVLESLQTLSQAGYTIALDDFVYEDRFRPFLEIADIVKIEVLDKTEGELEQMVQRLNPYQVRLLAEKVETQEEFERCKQLGFYYFQGYFFFRPDIIKGREIPANRLALLQLMANVQDPRISFDHLVEHIRNDLSLSYKILRYVNSASVGLPQRVESIDHAACLVGIDRIRTWATLIIMASGHRQPGEILVMALIRAKMCERLGQAQGSETPEKYFTMGLLSVLEALYETSMEDILNSLPLPEDTGEALVNGTGPMGLALTSVKAYEEGNWMELKQLQLDPAIIRDIYLESVEWANNFSLLLN